MKKEACVLLSQCIFLKGKVVQMPQIDENLKRNYCNSNYHQCARYLMYKEVGMPKLPVHLIPEQGTQVMAAIEKRVAC